MLYGDEWYLVFLPVGPVSTCSQILYNHIIDDLLFGSYLCLQVTRGKSPDSKINCSRFWADRADIGLAVGFLRLRVNVRQGRLLFLLLRWIVPHFWQVMYAQLNMLVHVE